MNWCDRLHLYYDYIYKELSKLHRSKLKSLMIDVKISSCTDFNFARIDTSYKTVHPHNNCSPLFTLSTSCVIVVGANQFPRRRRDICNLEIEYLSRILIGLKFLIFPEESKNKSVSYLVQYWQEWFLFHLLHED